MTDAHRGKYLSHRGRGFSEIELTANAVINAAKSGAKYIEIDTRVSKDKIIYVYHNGTGDQFDADGFKFCETESDKINAIKYRNGETILTLQECVDIIREYGDGSQILCIDIKDYGYEEEHYEIVQKSGMRGNVFFISWIPQVLIRLHTLDNSIPLYLSYLNANFGGVFSSAFSYLIRNFKFKIGGFVILGENRFNDGLAELSTGFQHCFITSKLPPPLLGILKESNGGVCVNASLANKYALDYFESEKLNVMVFSAKNLKEFEKYYRSDAVKIVFCDFSI